MFALIRPFLPYIAGALIIIGLVIGIDHRGYQRGLHRRDAEIAAMQAAAAKQEAQNAEKVAQAANDYAAKVSAMQPIILRSTDKVTTYAQTPAGRAECLDASRVSTILEDRAALAAASTGSNGSLPARTDPATQPDQR